jgi:S1-C subfamily serine protease
MKTLLTTKHLTFGWPVILASLLAAVPRPTAAAKVFAASASAVPEEASAPNAEASDASEPRVVETRDVIIEANPEGEVSRKDIPWLGVSTTEASEVLTSQLDLEPGVGLVISYVVPESPAAKIGLRKNDLLVQFEDQSLVHPAQLRKLVRVRKEGDVVKLAFYRAGKRQTVSVALGKTKTEAGFFDEQEHG